MSTYWSLIRGYFLSMGIHIQRVFIHFSTVTCKKKTLYSGRRTQEVRCFSGFPQRPAFGLLFWVMHKDVTILKTGKAAKHFADVELYSSEVLGYFGESEMETVNIVNCCK